MYQRVSFPIKSKDILEEEYDRIGFQTRMVSQLFYQRNNLLSEASPVFFFVSNNESHFL